MNAIVLQILKPPNAYEGHYLHRNTNVESTIEKNYLLEKGDFFNNHTTKGVKYLLETLEPEGLDSFFNWNFF